MFIRIENEVVNTDQIHHLNIVESQNKIKVYFSKEDFKTFNFKDINDLDSFLSMINVKDL